jgi:hypothetical protein
MQLNQTRSVVCPRCVYITAVSCVSFSASQKGSRLSTMKHVKAIAAAVTTATATVIAAVAYATLIVLDFSGYLPILTAHRRPAFDEPPERTFKQPPNFQQSKRLQNILQQIQSHIAKSTSTREHYASVCKRIDAMLLDRSARARLSEGDVKNHFNSNWPAFTPLHPSSMKFKDQILWGWTDKSTDGPNEIHLNPDLVRELEAAPEVCEKSGFLDFPDPLSRAQTCSPTSR